MPVKWHSRGTINPRSRVPIGFSRCQLLKLNKILFYYMALSHKDWELPNSRIWLAEMDIDRDLDFPI